MEKLTLKMCRAKYGLSQEEMAKALDIAASTYWKWEKEPALIRGSYQEKIARLTGVEVDQIDWGI